MGWWGNLGGPKQRGIVSYSLSPLQQRVFAGALHQAIFNTSRRITSQIPYVGTALLAGYSIYTWAKARHEFLLSKAGHAEGEH